MKKKEREGEKWELARFFKLYYAVFNLNKTLSPAMDNIPYFSMYIYKPQPCVIDTPISSSNMKGKILVIMYNLHPGKK